MLQDHRTAGSCLALQVPSSSPSLSFLLSPPPPPIFEVPHQSISRAGLQWTGPAPLARAPLLPMPRACPVLHGTCRRGPHRRIKLRGSMERRSSARRRPRASSSLLRMTPQSPQARRARGRLAPVGLRHGPAGRAERRGRSDAVSAGSDPQDSAPSPEAGAWQERARGGLGHNAGQGQAIGAVSGLAVRARVGCSGLG